MKLPGVILIFMWALNLSAQTAGVPPDSFIVYNPKVLFFNSVEDVPGEKWEYIEDSTCFISFSESDSGDVAWLVIAEGNKYTAAVFPDIVVNKSGLHISISPFVTGNESKVVAIDWAYTSMFSPIQTRYIQLWNLEKMQQLMSFNYYYTYETSEKCDCDSDLHETLEVWVNENGDEECYYTNTVCSIYDITFEPDKIIFIRLPNCENTDITLIEGEPERYIYHVTSNGVTKGR